MRRRPLACRLGRHRPLTLVAVRHYLHPTTQWGLTRPGSVETFRCERCGARVHRVSDRYLWRLQDVLKRR
jgi:hypothetical protein